MIRNLIYHFSSSYIAKYQACRFNNIEPAYGQHTKYILVKTLTITSYNYITSMQII